MPWAGFVWGFSHRLELIFKGALSEWMNQIATNLPNLYI